VQCQAPYDAGVSDPLEPVRRAIVEGKVGLRELARATKVPPMTIASWLKRGTPKALVQGLRVIAWVVERPGNSPSAPFVPLVDPDQSS